MSSPFLLLPRRYSLQKGFRSTGFFPMWVLLHLSKKLSRARRMLPPYGRLVKSRGLQSRQAKRYQAPPIRWLQHLPRDLSELRRKHFALARLVHRHLPVVRTNLAHRSSRWCEMGANDAGRPLAKLVGRRPFPILRLVQLVKDLA